MGKLLIDEIIRMLDVILVLCILFLVLTFFYKQATTEFRLNQIDWTQANEKLMQLFTERVPIVIKGIPRAPFWTNEDVLMRDCYSHIQVFEDKSLKEWLTVSEPTTQCPWKSEHASIIAAANGLSIWSERWMNSVIRGSILYKAWLHPSYSCWAGERGLFKTVAPWTILFVTDGAVGLTILPETMETSLPQPWAGYFPAQLTAYDTPFVGDLKFLDIILRPGNCVAMPAHWFVSWTSLEDEKVCPMVCSIEYHSPISLFASKLHNSDK